MYGDLIVDALEYKMQLDESIPKNAALTVAVSNKADYGCWKLFKRKSK